MITPTEPKTKSQEQPDLLFILVKALTKPGDYQNVFEKIGPAPKDEDSGGEWPEGKMARLEIQCGMAPSDDGYAERTTTATRAPAAVAVDLPRASPALGGGPTSDSGVGLAQVGALLLALLAGILLIQALGWWARGNRSEPAMSLRARRHVFAVVAALVSVLLATSLVVALRRAEIREIPIIETLLILPLVVYAIGAGLLNEIKGPGGLWVKFREFAEQPVDPAGHTPLDAKDLAVRNIPKLSPGDVEKQIGRIKDGKPIVLTLTLGKGVDYYAPGMTADVIETLVGFRNFKFVVVTDEAEQLVAYTQPWALSKQLKSYAEYADKIIRDINQGRGDEVKKNPIMITTPLRLPSNNTAALQEMEKINLEAIVVVDENGKYTGVVERDRILSRMMVALAQGSAVRG